MTSPDAHVDAAVADAAAPADAFVPTKPLQWTVELAGMNLTGVWANDPKDIYAIGDDGSIEHSDDDGGSWTAQQSHVAHLSAIWGDSTDVFAVGGGAILHTSDRGQTWNAEPSPSAGPFYDVWGNGAEVCVVGAGGVILKSADRGATWSAQSTGTTQDLMGVWGSGSDDIYAVGGQSTMLHSSDGGWTWTSQLPAAAARDFSSVWGAGANDVYAVAWDTASSSSYVLESLDHGATWTQVGVGGPGPPSPHAVWASGPGDVYMLVTADSILHSAAKGWISELGGLESPTAVRGSSPSDVWVAAFGGLMHGHP